MTFRPYPVLTVVTLLVLAVLIGLGVWQVERAGWKAALIADFETASAAAPEAPDAVLCTAADATRKIVSPPATSGASLRVFGHNAAGDAGWRLFQAGQLTCGQHALIETGFEALMAGPDSMNAPAPQPATKFLVEAWPGKQWMATENSPATNEWHWFDAPSMKAALGAGDLNTEYILTPLSGMPDYLTRTPPSGHIGYAVTWFGMAIGLVVIYGLFHARAGRLRFRKQGSGHA